MFGTEKKNQEALDALRKKVHDKDDQVQRDAYYKIGEIAKENQEAYELLKKLANDRNAQVRRDTAVYGLGEIAKENQEAFELLKKLANDGEKWVRQGAAFGLAQAFDNTSADTLFKIRSLLQGNISPEVLSTLSNLARNKTISRIFDFYSDLSIEKDMEFVLKKAVNVFRNTQSLRFGGEFFNVYKLLHDALACRSIEEIITVNFKALENLDKEFKNSFSNLILGIKKLSEIPIGLSKYERADDLGDKLIYLTEALHLIDITKAYVNENLIEPENRIFKEILDGWRRVIYEDIRIQKGKAVIKIELKSKKMPYTERITILLGVKNEGRSIAENFIIKIKPSLEYDIIEGAKRIPLVSTKKDYSREFTIRPFKDKFRVLFQMQYDDAERKGKIIDFADYIELFGVKEPFKEFVNPYTPGRPIKTRDMFYGREDVFEFIRENLFSLSQNNVLLLHGQRRTGKTSILYQLNYRIGDKHIPVLFDMQGFPVNVPMNKPDEGTRTFFYKMALEITNALKGRGIEIKSPQEEQFKNQPGIHFENFLNGIEEKIGEKRILLMFDEFDVLEKCVLEGRLNRGILEFLRHLVQHSKKLDFIFTGTHKIEEMRADYWNVLFGLTLYKKISFLGDEDAKKLIVNPVKDYLNYDDLAIDKILRVTAGHPYFIQLICHPLVVHCHRIKKNYITLQDVNIVLENVMEMGHIAFDYIWDALSARERVVLVALNKVLAMEGIATISSLTKYLSELCSFSSTEIYKILKNLVLKDIIDEEIDEEHPHLRFKIEIVRMWIDKNQRMDKVIVEMKNVK